MTTTRCACKIVQLNPFKDGTISYCPLHAAADDMAQALTVLIRSVETATDGSDGLPLVPSRNMQDALDHASVILRKAGGEPTTRNFWPPP